MTHLCFWVVGIVLILIPSGVRAGSIDNAKSELKNANTQLYKTYRASSDQTPENFQRLYNKIVAPVSKKLQDADRAEEQEVIKKSGVKVSSGDPHVLLEKMKNDPANKKPKHKSFQVSSQSGSRNSKTTGVGSIGSGSSPSAEPVSLDSSGIAPEIDYSKPKKP